MEKKHPTSFRLSPEALGLLEALAKHLGVSHTAVLEMLIRERARKERIGTKPAPAGDTEG